MRFNKKLSTVIILLISILACKDNKPELCENPALFSEFPVSDSITFKEIYDYKKGVVNNLFIIDSTLVIHNKTRGAKFLFYNYSINSGELSKGYVAKGRGPNEILSSFSSGFTKNYFYVHDMALKKIMRINKEDVLIKSKDSLVFEEFRFKEHTGIRVAFTDSSNYYGVENLSSEFKITEMDLSLDIIIEEFGEFKKIPEKFPTEVLKQVYSPLINLSPNGQKLVLAYRYTDVIEIYNLNSKKSIAVQGPDIYNVDYKVGKDNMGYYMEFIEKTKIAFVDCHATEKKIYLLYSGRSKKEGNEKFVLGIYIYVYDWNGKPIKKITLDRGIPQITISKDEKKIYSYDMISGAILEANLN